MQDQENQGGAGEAPETRIEPVNTVSPKPPTEPGAADAPAVIPSISERLSEHSGGGKDVAEPEAPKAAEPQAFDLSKLTPDQLSQLKAMLNATPDRVSKRQVNPIVKLRKIGEKVVVDFRNAYLALVDDPENNRKVERHVIPVRFIGSEKFEVVLYKDFMESPHVNCEAVKVYSEPDSVEEGEVYSKERGAMVPLEVKFVRYSFDLKIPGVDGITRVDGKVANA